MKKWMADRFTLVFPIPSQNLYHWLLMNKGILGNESWISFKTTTFKLSTVNKVFDNPSTTWIQQLSYKYYFIWKVFVESFNTT